MSSGPFEKSVLIVCPEGFDRSGLPGYSHPWLEYAFVKTYPADGFAAWKVDSTATSVKVEVASSCEQYRGGFSQQALNRFFAEALIGHRVCAVVVVGLSGCTVDLPRVAAFMGVPSVLMLDKPAEDPLSLDEATVRWIRDSLSKCQFIIPISAETPQQWPPEWIELDIWGGHDQLTALLASDTTPGKLSYGFDYATYEFCQRDHPLLKAMQRGDTTHFTGCKRVLDLGCGVGIFLDCLRQQGIEGVGIERDPAIADYGRGMGLDIVTGDALEYLEQTDERFDGIYCSHFVEHLPFELVQKLINLLASRLVPGGVVVLTFPDPESIRSQLLGFWRDPEHVRFYHPDLVTALAAAAALELEWSSYDAQPHRVVAFSEQAPEVADNKSLSPLPLRAEPTAKPSGFGHILSKLGLVSRRHLDAREHRFETWAAQVQSAFEQQRLINDQLKQRTDSLWDVNKTWAWNDNATLKYRKLKD